MEVYIILNIQYKKGVIELCIFSLLYKADRYGYDISEYLSRHIDISDGTVYPILRKLKSEGLVTTYLSEESGGPPRKYYKLTKTGIDSYLKDRQEWLDFVDTVHELIKEAENE
jgi:PadR family transcriptional regulator PadR